MSHPLLVPESIDAGLAQERWMVVIYNDDHIPYDAVIFILMCATECEESEAELETWEAHHYGKAPVHFADKSECERAAKVISSIGVKTEVAKEWDE